MSIGSVSTRVVARDSTINGCGWRIAIVGTTGSGKTTLARQLAMRFGIPQIELDALHWGPNWDPAPVEVLRERTTRALSGETWVADGNYSTVRGIVWGRADTLIWLDYPLRVILWRLLRRSLRRSLLREELWNGNRETLRAQFASRESLFLWVLQTYWRRKREYPALLAKPEYAHLAVVRLHSPGETHRWLLRSTGQLKKPG